MDSLARDAENKTQNGETVRSHKLIERLIEEIPSMFKCFIPGKFPQFQKDETFNEGQITAKVATQVQSCMQAQLHTL